MDFLEIFFITLFCIFQSIFGVGLLLLGTPTFLLLEYNFFEVLNILLPYSIVISLLQIIASNKRNFEFGKKILFHSIPFLIMGLIIIDYLQNKIDLTIIVSFFLIIFSIVNIKNIKGKKLKIKKVNLSLRILGLFHGLTNLGGSILTLISSNLSSDKSTIRYNISSGYFIFALFQLLTINLFFNQINFDNLKFIWLPIIVFILSQKFFKRMKNVIYFISLNLIILLYGIYIFTNIVILNFK